MASARDLFTVLRPGNGAMAALAVLIGAAVANTIWGSEPFLWLDVFAAMVAAFAILSFGNILNDVWDADIDRRAHPERPIPSGRMSLSTAGWAAGLALAFGLLAAFLAGGAVLVVFAGVNAGLLAAYARLLKATPLLGNVVVAGLVSSAFIFGALSMDGWAAHREWGSLWGFAAMAFFTNVARENAKGLQDAPHDSGRATLARIAPRAAIGLGIAATVAACVLALWMFILPLEPWWLARPMTWRGVGAPGVPSEANDWWRFGVVASIPVFLFGAWLMPREPGRSQKVLKVAMVVALGGYGLGALLH